MDGIECTKAILKHERDGQIVKHVPIIAVTANARDEQLKAAKAVGMVNLIHSGLLRLSESTC